MPSRPDPTRWYAALATMVVAVLLAWLLGAVLDVTAGERTVLHVAFVTLGLVAAVAIVWYLRPTDAPPPDAADTMRDDALVAIAAARARLPRGALHASPVVLLLGAEGSDTTAVATRNGLDPELLAGDAIGVEGTATANANVWKVGGAVLVEAGAPLLGDTERWKRFVRALRAPRVAAAVGRSEAAPRAVVACVSCGLFYAGGGAQLDALAQLLRQRLSELANDWGLSLPVYVVFTQADLVPHFEAWAAPLTRDEARAPLGAALPFEAATGAVGSYAERLVPRLDAAFRQLAESLAAWRLTLLGRESVAERRLAAYEFAREIGKLAPAATRFLAELCRPTQLGTSPMLRGFYFVGIRPVVVGDVAAPMSVAAAAPAAVRASDATGVFVYAPSAPAPAAVGYAMPTARRVPQWTFLDRLFPEVVLADTGALAAARGGTRVSGLRRALLGAGIAAALVMGVGVASSWANNRALARRVETAARAVATLPPVTAGSLASVESLARLDTLRALLDTVRAYDVDDPPFRLRWGLWRDGVLFAEGRRVWLAAYGRQLHEPAWTALADSLRALPAMPRPTDEYVRVYENLRAYLVTTDAWQRATPPMVAPVLARSWQRGEPVPDAAAPLAERQFAFYASLLPAGNPFPRAADRGVVQGAQRLLAGFGGTERIYQAKVQDASGRYPAARLVSLAPQAGEALRVPADVPGAFTAASWRFMDSTFRDTSVVVQGDAWVVGDVSAAQMPDRARMLAELQGRYRREYVERWRAFVRESRVTPMADPRDAVNKLRVLRDARSPLFATFALAARNTAVDSGIAAAFQPVSLVSPAQESDKLFTEASQPYIAAVDALLASVEQVANLSTQDDSISVMMRAQMASQVLAGQVTAAKTSARALARDFASDTAAMWVRDAAGTLLLAPIEEVERVLNVLVRERPRPAPVAGGGGEPPEQIRRRVTGLARDLCADLKPLLDKFPFAPASKTAVSPDEVKAIFAPETGKLWLMYADGLEGLIVKQGQSWVADPAAPVKLSATFVSFFDRAAKASDGLFATGGPELQVNVTARGVPSGRVKTVELRSGQKATLAAGASASQVSWTPATTSASLDATFRRNNLPDQTKPIAVGRNDWALFRLAAAGQWTGGGDKFVGTWRSSGDAVAVEFTFPKAAPVLVPGWLGAMSCTSEVVR